MRDGAGGEYDHLEWLVERRSAVQAELLRILKLIRSRDAELNRDVRLLGITHLMIGSAFSLWRAVFLGNVTLGRERIAQKAEEFLELLIADNAIGYPQDRMTSEWTFGYYLNNATCRIGELSSRSPAFSSVLKQNDIHEMKWQIIADFDPRALWDRAFLALHLAVVNAGSIFEEAKASGAGVGGQVKISN